MTKRKRIIIMFAALLLVLVFGVFAVVNYYVRLANTGLKNAIPYGFGKEARVIILAGQSNAEGFSQLAYLKKTTTPEQYARYEKGFDNVYVNDFTTAEEKWGGFVRCKAGERAPDGFFGPELGLAERLSELYPDETFFIIKFAWGGTDLANLWRAPSSGGEIGQLYSGLIEHVAKSIEFLTLKNYDVKIEAMCWMQGESDAEDIARAAEYESNLAHFVSDVRAALADHAAPGGIGFVDAYISRSWEHYKTVNAAKQEIADTSPMNVVIDTIAMGLTVTKEPEKEPDTAHYDAGSEIKLGHLFAEECAKFFDETQ